MSISKNLKHPADLWAMLITRLGLSQAINQRCHCSVIQDDSIIHTHCSSDRQYLIYMGSRGRPLISGMIICTELAAVIQPVGVRAATTAIR